MTGQRLHRVPGKKKTEPYPPRLYYYDVEIITLDAYARLPYNFAIISGTGAGRYHEFRTLNAAKAFIRKVALSVA